MYQAHHNEYVSHLSGQGLTEKDATERGFIFLHSYFLWQFLTYDCQLLIAKHEIELDELAGYLIPYHTAKGRMCGAYRIYLLGALKEFTLNDPLNMNELGTVTSKKFVEDLMREDAKGGA